MIDALHHDTVVVSELEAGSQLRRNVVDVNAQVRT
jgi:hypothetical protein